MQDELNTETTITYFFSTQTFMQASNAQTDLQLSSGEVATFASERASVWLEQRILWQSSCDQ